MLVLPNHLTHVTPLLPAHRISLFSHPSHLSLSFFVVVACCLDLHSVHISSAFVTHAAHIHTATDSISFVSVHLKCFNSNSFNLIRSLLN